jgi:hypothetical protein
VRPNVNYNVHHSLYLPANILGLGFMEIKLTTFASEMMIDDDDNDEKRGEN